MVPRADFEPFQTPARLARTNESSDIDRGRAALGAYVRSAGLGRVEANQDYTITDAIVSLLKVAKERGFEPLPASFRS